MLFGKKTTETAAPTTTTVEPAVDPSRPHGKGRPTPKRREAEAANRRPLVAGSTKGKSPEEKRKIREQRAKVREGMMRGEEKYLHERDRGPERRFLRDAVDRRWNIGEILLPVMILILALSLLPFDWAQNGMFLSAYALMLFGIVDSWLLWRRTKKDFVAEFGHEPGKGSAWYVVLRAFQMRGSRIPRPAVDRGADLVRR
ncbi:DUF3043 domain-containing protein [Ornithinimicrobium sp. CNJ-824]|uniref:DUF3043 domain-containing protein n=1 Tax=Ornithinimicrobium sp. CNJ-824 TaxID=1904966 RepID=UPI0009FA5AD5|nr:DUF3043 domain-containing protein [Ornithinimicrobium sp. CNJ-824]